jgi:hypothetical protein
VVAYDKIASAECIISSLIKSPHGKGLQVERIADSNLRKLCYMNAKKEGRV